MRNGVTFNDVCCCTAALAEETSVAKTHLLLGPHRWLWTADHIQFTMIRNVWKRVNTMLVIPKQEMKVFQVKEYVSCCKTLSSPTCQLLSLDPWNLCYHNLPFASSYYVCEKINRQAPLWPPMLVRSPLPLIILALSSGFLQELPLNTSWHRIKVGHFKPPPFSQSLVMLVFGVAPPPSTLQPPGSDLIRLMQTLGCKGRFQCQRAHNTVPCWNLQLNTGCDTLRKGHGISAPCSDFFDEEDKSEGVWVYVCLCVWRRQQR